MKLKKKLPRNKYKNITLKNLNRRLIFCPDTAFKTAGSELLVSFQMRQTKNLVRLFLNF